jgi:predicted GNAT superfamily acetyltransferase
MTIEHRYLSGTDELLAVERLQIEFFGEHAARSILPLPVLRGVVASGGLVLGAWDDTEPNNAPVGALVDLAGSFEGFPAQFTLFGGVLEGARNRGVGFGLRIAERGVALERGIEVIRWWIDPLRGEEAHMAFNRLGAVGVGYDRNLFGELSDSANAGLATDRCLVEWWIRSPRSESIVVEESLAPHYRLGFHEMTVVTKTTLTASGQRALVDFDPAPAARYVLSEIPVFLDALRREDPAEARKWRLSTRELFENLFGSGYLLVGLVHEAGRSFHLFEAASRGAVLGNV